MYPDDGVVVFNDATIVDAVAFVANIFRSLFSYDGTNCLFWFSCWCFNCCYCCCSCSDCCRNPVGPSLGFLFRWPTSSALNDHVKLHAM